MSEQNTQLKVPGTRMVFNILSYTPIFFIILLLGLGAIIPDLGSKSSTSDIFDTDTDFVNLLFFILLLIIPIQYIVANKIITYANKNEQNLKNRFGFYIIAINMYVTISIYGLLLGLLSIFTITPPYLNWIQVLIFISLSIFFSRGFISSTINP